jgi:hypothetical protein
VLAYESQMPSLQGGREEVFGGAGRVCFPEGRAMWAVTATSAAPWVGAALDPM